MVLFHLTWSTPCPLIYVVDTEYLLLVMEERAERVMSMCVCVVVLLFL